MTCNKLFIHALLISYILVFSSACQKLRSFNLFDNNDGQTIEEILQTENSKDYPLFSSTMKKWMTRQDLKLREAEKSGEFQNQLRLQLARASLKVGEATKALEYLSPMANPLDKSKTSQEVLELLGLSYLRLSEQESCIKSHASESCIYPLQGAGLHRTKDLLEKSSQAFEKLLKLSTTRKDIDWLFKLTLLAHGKNTDYSTIYNSTPGATWPKFKELSSQNGLSFSGYAGGSIAEDFDNDGDFDLMVSSYQKNEPLKYFENDGHGQFIDRTNSSGIQKQLGGFNLISGDYDNDGLVDVMVLRGAWMPPQFARWPSSLLKNLGGGRFKDVTKEVGLFFRDATQTAAWMDANNDGWLDLVVGFEGHGLKLFHGSPKLIFSDVTKESGLPQQGNVKGVLWGHFWEADQPGLFVSRLGQTNQLFRPQIINNKIVYKNVSKDAKIEHPINSFPAGVVDFDNDGLDDIFIFKFLTDYTSDFHTREVLYDFVDELKNKSGERIFRAYLYKGLGRGKFAEVGIKMGLNLSLVTMGFNFADLDNDGWMDFYLGTGAPAMSALVPNRLFRNVLGQRFVEETVNTRTGHLQKGHGISFADFRHLGLVDIFVNTGGVYPGDFFRRSYFANTLSPQKYSWLEVELKGVRNNRFGVGAKLRIEGTTESGKSNIIFRRINTGGTFGANSLRQHIGLGAIHKVKKIEVFWPNGMTSEFKNTKLNSRYTLSESGEVFSKGIHK